MHLLKIVQVTCVCNVCWDAFQNVTWVRNTNVQGVPSKCLIWEQVIALGRKNIWHKVMTIFDVNITIRRSDMNLFFILAATLWM